MVYQIIGWILLPITALLALCYIFVLLATPILGVLIADVLFVGALLYFITTMRFLRKNIVPNVPATRSLRLSIRVFAFFVALLAVDIISACVTVLFHQDMIKPILDNAFYITRARAGEPAISYAQLHQLVIVLLWVFLIYALLLLLHLLMSFFFLRRYRHLFEQER